MHCKNKTLSDRILIEEANSGGMIEQNRSMRFLEDAALRGGAEKVVWMEEEAGGRQAGYPQGPHRQEAPGGGCQDRVAGQSGRRTPPEPIWPRRSARR